MIKSMLSSHLKNDKIFSTDNVENLDQIDFINYPPGVGGEFISILIARYSQGRYYEFDYTFYEERNRYIVNWEDAVDIASSLKSGKRCLLRTHDIHFMPGQSYYIYCDLPADRKKYNLLANIKINTKKGYHVLKNHNKDLRLPQFFKDRPNTILMSRIFEDGYLGSFFGIANKEFDEELRLWESRNEKLILKYGRFFWG